MPGSSSHVTLQPDKEPPVRSCGLGRSRPPALPGPAPWAASRAPRARPRGRAERSGVEGPARRERPSWADGLQAALRREPVKRRWSPLLPRDPETPRRGPADPPCPPRPAAGQPQGPCQLTPHKLTRLHYLWPRRRRRLAPLRQPRPATGSTPGWR